MDAKVLELFFGNVREFSHRMDRDNAAMNLKIMGVSALKSAALLGSRMQCVVPDPSDPGKVCNGDVDIQVDAYGAYFVCQKDGSHKITLA